MLLCGNIQLFNRSLDHIDMPSSKVPTKNLPPAAAVRDLIWNRVYEKLTANIAHDKVSAFPVEFRQDIDTSSLRGKDFMIHIAVELRMPCEVSRLTPEGFRVIHKKLSPVLTKKNTVTYGKSVVKVTVVCRNETHVSLGAQSVIEKLPKSFVATQPEKDERTGVWMVRVVGEAPINID